LWEIFEHLKTLTKDPGEIAHLEGLIEEGKLREREVKKNAQKESQY